MAITGPDVVAARLSSSVAAILFFTAAIVVLALRNPSTEVRAGFAWFWLFAVGICGPFGLFEIASTFRSYVWIFAFGTVQVAVLYAVVSGDRNWTTTGLGMIAALGAVTLHYANGVAAVAIALSTLIVAWVSGARRQAVAIGSAAMLGSAITVGTALLQRPQWPGFFDYNWVADLRQSGLAAIAYLLSTYLIFNLVTVCVIVWQLAERNVRRADLWVLLPVVIAVPVLFVIHTATPLILPRYLLLLPILASMLAASLLSRVRLPCWGIAIICAGLLAQLCVQAVKRPPIAGWEGTASKIASLTRQCPSTKVFAASHWAFSPGRNSHIAAFESNIVRFAYDRVSRKAGFTVNFLDPRTLKAANPGHCADILWIEHAAGLGQFKPEQVFRRVGLNVPPEAEIERIDGENGSAFIIRRRPAA